MSPPPAAADPSNAGSLAVGNSESLGATCSETGQTQKGTSLQKYPNVLDFQRAEEFVNMQVS